MATGDFAAPGRPDGSGPRPVAAGDYAVQLPRLNPLSASSNPGIGQGDAADVQALIGARQAKQELEQTLDCIRDLIFVVDVAGRVCRCNQAVRELFGRDEQEILGRDLVELCESNGLFLPSDFEIHEVQLSGGKWYSFKQHYLGRRSGAEANFNKVVTFHDITLIKAIREELEVEHAKLQERNAQLEMAMAELKSAQARILQQENMAAIGQLAAGVAHEINTPLGFISGNLGALDRYLTKLDEFIARQDEAIANPELAEKVAVTRKRLKVDYLLKDGHELIGESLTGTARIAEIVDNLRCFSRLDDGGAPYAADLNECMENTVAILSKELLLTRTIRKEYSPLPRVRCLARQLNQVFMNLLINATQAVDPGGEIVIRTWAEAGLVKVAISDNGCGIPADLSRRIFEPFFTTKPVGQGTGLGLAICYEIVTRHAGEILLESQVGQGATFTVVLPVGD